MNDCRNDGLPVKRLSGRLLAVLLLGLFAMGQQKSAFAQAGSTGGTIGKTDKSVSGSEEADRPRAVSHPKRLVASSRETSSGHSCGGIVGRWRWYLGVTEMAFNQNGTVRQSISGNQGSWTCTGTVVTSVFPSGDRDRIIISKNGNSAAVTTTWGGGRSFTVTRLSGGTSQ